MRVHAGERRSWNICRKSFNVDASLDMCRIYSSSCSRRAVRQHSTMMMGSWFSSMQERRRRKKKDHKPKKEIQAAQKKVFIGADAEFRDEVKIARHSQVSVSSEQPSDISSDPCELFTNR